jgi:hypothetical protein
MNKRARAFYKQMALIRCIKNNYVRDVWLDWLFDAEIAML